METITKHEIKETAWPEKTFITKRAKMRIDQLPGFFPGAYGEIYGAIQKSGLQATEPPCAFYYSMDEANKTTDVAAAAPVKGVVPDLPGLERVVLPASKVVTTTHYGPYEKMAEAYGAIQQYLVDHGLKQELVIEEYFSDPQVEKDPEKWKTNIHFLVK